MQIDVKVAHLLALWVLHSNTNINLQRLMITNRDLFYSYEMGWDVAKWFKVRRNESFSVCFQIYTTRILDFIRWVTEKRKAFEKYYSSMNSFEDSTLYEGLEYYIVSSQTLHLVTWWKVKPKTLLYHNSFYRVATSNEFIVVLIIIDVQHFVFYWKILFPAYQSNNGSESLI